MNKFHYESISIKSNLIIKSNKLSLSTQQTIGCIVLYYGKFVILFTQIICT